MSNSNFVKNLVAYQSQSKMSIDNAYANLLDKIDINDLNEIFGIESNLAIMMALSGIQDVHSGKTFHDNIQLLNVECLEFQIQLDEAFVEKAADIEPSNNFTNELFKDEFVKLITSHKTKMKICPSIPEIHDKINTIDINDDDVDSDKNDDLDEDQLKHKIEEVNSSKGKSRGSNFTPVVGNMINDKFDDFGIVADLTAFPYEKPIQRIFEILESVYCINNAEKRRCFLCLRMSASYAVISCAIARIFRNNQSLNDRYVCRRCYESVKSFLINAERRMLRNEPLSEIKGTQINYKNCCNKFLMETEVTLSFDVGKLDVEAKTLRFRVERDFPILRQQLKYFKKYMVESILPIFKQRLQHFKSSNSSIIAIGKYFSGVISVFDFINDTLIAAMSMYKSLNNIRYEVSICRQPNHINELFCHLPCSIAENPLLPFKPNKDRMIHFEIKVNDTVYCQTNDISIWRKAIVIQLVVKERQAVIRWHHDSEKEIRHFRQIAFSFIYPSQLQVGERVISNFYQYEKQNEIFHSGHLLETLSEVNRNRYLILFDNGEVHYVPHYFIRKVLLTDCISRNEGNQKVFLDTYFQMYPKKKNIHRTNRKLFYVEHNFEWEKAKIIHYDCSLVFVEHLNCKKMEWIAITSNRITSNEKMVFSEVNYRREIIESGTIFRRHMSTISYLDDVYNPKNPSVKRKSNYNSITDNKRIKNDTDTIPLYGNHSDDENHSNSDDKDENENDLEDLDDDDDDDDDDDEEEDDGDEDYVDESDLHNYVNFHEPYIEINELNETKEEKTEFLNANCSCKNTKRNYRIKTKNPLRQPELHGWKRLKLKNNDDIEYITYQTPCNESVYDFKVLYKHLLDIKSDLTVENFSFDKDINCTRELTDTAEKALINNDDLSFGKESIPISVVNELNYQCPTDFTYLTDRKPSTDINLNLSPDFLVCCDCTDDCSDLYKCQCRSLTVQEAQETIKAIGDDEITVQKIGYQFMRLENQIKCGIYECNQKCKCSKRCLNRVAQLPLRQSLQLYMTEKRGWGIRALHDIPKGTFICRYGGIIMTDDEANNDGIIFGDEYFADLDYIEVVEAIKEGYEDDVEEDDDEDEEDDYEKNKKSKKDSKAERKNDRPSKTRELFKDKHSDMFIIDAKTTGNVGRYFNHSCEPNLFVQNVFIDSHDIRFPWVCFFTSRAISMGEELTWDYSYTPGSVPGRQIFCMCEAKTCRGRLL